MELRRDRGGATLNAVFHRWGKGQRRSGIREGDGSLAMVVRLPHFRRVRSITPEDQQ
jgi:hypothetical protein